MKLYDFSAYASRRNAKRQEEAAAKAVIESITHIEDPGAVVRLKLQVDNWFCLHRDVMLKQM